MPNSSLPVGAVCIGGLGDGDGLRTGLCDEVTDAVVKITPPVGDDHHSIRRRGVISNCRTTHSRVFLTTNRSSVKAFTDSEAWFF